MGHPENFTQDELSVAVTEVDEMMVLSTLAQPHKHPKAFLLGGQSGAGKTRMQNILLKEERLDALVINGDLYRRNHPRIEEIINVYGIEEMPRYTAQWLASFVEELIKRLAKMHFNLIIEGTLRTVETPVRTADFLLSHGYRVALAVMAVKPAISLVSCQVRFFKMRESGTHPRTVDPEIHNTIVEGLIENIRQLENSNLFEEIRVYSRTGQLLISASHNDDVESVLPSDIMERVLFGAWTLEEESHYEYLLQELHHFEELDSGNKNTH